jgi:3-hydroxyacyl-[acyl-carrier-protein] dehydratase
MPNPCLSDRTFIESILPHRDPFLFVDKISAFSASETITAELFLVPEWPFFRGHFPGRPVMPGVLIIEALAQTSGLLLRLTWREQGREAQESGSLFLGKAQIKFTASARAGDVLVLESRFKKSFAGLFLFDTVARVGDQPVAGGEITLAREREER